MSQGKFTLNRNYLFVLLLAVSTIVSSISSPHNKINAQSIINESGNKQMDMMDMKKKTEDMNMDMDMKEKMNMDDMDMGGEGEKHSHGMIDVTDLEKIPEVEISIDADRIGGWNLEVKTTNFAFTPENLNQDSEANEGHGHIYINGKKVGRIYSNWHYIPKLPEGEVEIEVTLNTNKHEDLMYEGKIVGDTLTLTNNKKKEK